jgi:hypothetical protein
LFGIGTTPQTTEYQYVCVALSLLINERLKSNTTFGSDPTLREGESFARSAPPMPASSYAAVSDMCGVFSELQILFIQLDYLFRDIR